MISKKHWRTARKIAKRDGWDGAWIRSDADVDAVVNHGCEFDEEAGLKVVNFFKDYLRHSKGRKWAGKPFVLLDWQRDDLIMPLFGWMRANGFRRYQIAYIEVPKKNGKSTLCAGIALYLLIFDKEPSAEIYGAAESRGQAGIVFREAMSMLEKSPDLKARLKTIASKNRIEYPRNGSFYQAISREAGTNEGVNTHGLVFDELHTQKSRTLWDCLEFSGEARDQPLLISITTAGYDRETICWEQHECATRILSGDEFDFSFFPLIYAASPKDDWQDEKVWFKANPSLGITIDLDKFREKVERAKNEPRKLNSLLRYRLDIWTQQDTAWLNPEDWAACAADFNREDLI